MEALYRRVLRAELDRLAPVLRRFHADPGSAAGTMAVEHGRGWTARVLARLFGAPAETAAVAVELRVVADRGVEVWDRTFGDRRLVTRQWESGALLVEAAGLFAVGFRVSVREGGLHFATERVWCCGIPWPRRLGPNITASARPGGDGWRLDVHVAAPIVGTIFRYHGTMVPT